MRPAKNDPPLTVVDLSQVTVGSLQGILTDTEYFGFPCVLDATSQLLAGFLTRKDIQFVLGECCGGWREKWRGEEREGESFQQHYGFRTHLERREGMEGEDKIGEGGKREAVFPPAVCRLLKKT